MTIALAAVWLVHGLYNKLLGGAPRHLAIVHSVPGLAGVAGERVLFGIGVIEVLIAIWMLSRRAPRWCAAAQTALLLPMNVIELTFARPLLLWPAGLLPLNITFLTLVWLTAWGHVSERTGARVEVGKTIARPSAARRRVTNLTPEALRRHPIAIRATLRECVTLTYALPAATLQPLLPPGLDLDTLGDLGFVAVALVQTERLRPDGFPPALGGNFFLAGYRVFARFTQPDGRTLRGLRILRSETDRTLMALGGNLLTHYNYHRCQARTTLDAETWTCAIVSRDGFGDLDVSVHLGDEMLPPHSPFASVREARRFAGPLPFTFDYEGRTNSIVAIEGRRTNWRPALVRADVRCLRFFEQPAFARCEPRLAAAFHLRDVEYHWRRGVRHAL